MEAMEKLGEELDMILESDADIEKYGVNTELDAGDFSRELFGRIYGDAEQVKDNEWSAAHDELDKLDEMKTLMKSCQGDGDLSILASSFIIDKCSEEIAAIVRDYRSYQADQSNQSSEGLPMGGNEPFVPSPDATTALSEKADELKDLIKQVQEAEEMIGLMGGKDPSLNDKDSDKDRVHLVRQLMDKHSKLRYIMKIVGRLRDSVRGLSANSLAEEQADTEIGVGRGKFSDLVFSEKMYLATEKSAIIYYDRHIKRKQFKFQKKGKTKKIGGPITILVDESTSMRGPREDIAKSVAAALFAMANEQNRGCSVMGFNTGITYKIRKNGKAKYSELIDDWSGRRKKMGIMNTVGYVANRTTRGGTSFSVAIREALKESKGKNADILFITDGEDHIDSSVLQKISKSKAKDGTRVFTILLGCRNPCLTSVSDGILPFNHLSDESITDLAKLMKSMER